MAGAKFSANVMTWTPVAVADTVNMTAQGFHALLGGSSTQRLNVVEVYMGGQAGASSPSLMVLARDSTVSSGVTSNVGRLAALDPATAALSAAPISTTVGSTTLPQRSSTLSFLAVAFNAFGGVMRWVAAPGEEIGILGNTASLGEISLSAFTGGTPGLMGSHLIFEAF